MKKWNMIIDVAECTNCNLCTLAAMDEYVGNDWPGYTSADAAARPQVDQHPAEGARAGADDRHRLRADHVQSLRRRAVPRQGRRRGEEARRRHHPDRSGQGEGPQGPGRHLPLRPHLVERGAQVPQVWPFDAHLLDQGWDKTRGAQSCPTGAMRAIKVEDDEMAQHGARAGPRGDEAGARHQAARLLPQPVALHEVLHRRHAWRRRRAASSTASRARACGSRRTARVVAETTTDNYGDFKFDKLDQKSGRYAVEVAAQGRKKAVEAVLGESLNLGEIRV